MKRRDFLKTVGAAFSTAMLAGCQNAFQTIFSDNNASRPNIIFIMADDHAAQALSCYGSYRNRTPNIDRLATEGMKFENCFCTNGICAPSRATILTGKFSHKNGVIDNLRKFDTSQQTFPKLLQDAGYKTAMIGKWHLKSAPTGFDYSDILPGQGVYRDPVMIRQGKREKNAGYVTDIITDKSIDWLKEQNSAQPFCLMCHHKAPHRSWFPDAEHADMYSEKKIPEPPTFNDDYSTRCDAARDQEMTIAHHLTPMDLKVDPPADWSGSANEWYQRGVHGEAWDPPNDLSGQELKEWKYQKYIKDYLRCIASIDDNIGRFLDYLDKSGLAENTIVVYTSDQGFYLGEHGWFDKRFMYEESLRMPFLIRYPKVIKPNSVSEEMIMNVDFAPTFLDFARVAIPDDMQGKSFKNVLLGRSCGDFRDAVYYHYYEYPGWHAVKRHRGIRTRRYKLIHFYYDIDCWELYDLEHDPHELRNVYSNPEYRDVAARLKAELKELRQKYDDTTERP